MSTQVEARLLFPVFLMYLQNAGFEGAKGILQFIQLIAETVSDRRFFCEFLKIFNNLFLTEHLHWLFL